MGSVWPEICSYATDIQLLLPSADVLCIAPHLMDLEQQLLVVASGAEAPAATLQRSLNAPPPSLHRSDGARHVAWRTVVRAHVFAG
jgi:hypothetical protein